MKKREELLIKFLNGECSPNEQEQIKRWLASDDFNEELSTILKDRWEEIAASENDESLLLEKIHLQLDVDQTANSNAQKVRNRFLSSDLSYYTKIAATVLIFIFSFLFTTYYLVDQKDETIVLTKEVKPVVKSTEIGQKRRIQLPDGTRVVLNSGSSIEYPISFAEKRLITLKGEAFFDVKHDSLRPFIVTTGSIQTTVLGTTFNIRESENSIDVALKTGKIVVHSLENLQTLDISPGEMVSKRTGNEEISISKVDVNLIANWTQGQLVFKSKSLKEIFDILETWYGVNINSDNNLDLRKKISGEFSNESLENILNGLSFSFDFSFSIDGKNVSIKS